MAKIKIVRKWSITRRRGAGDEVVIDIGQDMAGNVYGRCRKCEKNMQTLAEFNMKDKRIQRKLVCNSCKIRIDI